MIPWLLAMIACVAPMRDKGVVPAQSTLEALQQAREPRRYAVVVGVDAYDDPTFPALKHAGDDARAIGELLGSELGGFDSVVVLDDRDETERARVIDALRHLRDLARREDLVVVYFSGHGTRVPDGETWRRFLVPADAVSADLENSAIELEALQAYFSTLASARKALIVDACFNGDGKSRVRPADVEVPDGVLTPPASALAPGEAHLFATTAGRPSREDDKLGHGVYTWYLLDALSWSLASADVDEDGAVTAWEAHDWARGQVIARTRGAQVPEATFRMVGEADVELVGGDAARRASDRALVYLYPSASDPLDGATLVVDGRDKGVLPRSVPLKAGRHHVRLTRADGVVAIDGFVRLAPNRAYTVEEVGRLAQEPAQGVGWRLSTLSSPPMERAIGALAVGPELWVSKRVNEGPARGLTHEGWFGLAVSPTRRVDAGTYGGGGRPVFQLGGASGYQGDWRRLRARASWGVSVVWIPPSWIGDRPDAPLPYDHLSEAGWVVGGTGPGASLGWVLDGAWSVGASVRAHGAALDPDGTGVELVPWISAAVGVELAR